MIQNWKKIKRKKGIVSKLYSRVTHSDKKQAKNVSLKMSTFRSEGSVLQNKV